MKNVCKSIAAGAILCLAATPALADDHKSSEASSAKQTTMPESPQARAFLEQFGFSEAVIHNGTVWLSGIILGPAPEGVDEVEMYAASFARIGEILERAGSSWDDVLDITTYHVDIDQSIGPLSEAKNRYVKAPFPAWTAIDVDRLFAPEGLVEIKIVARVTPKAEDK